MALESNFGDGTKQSCAASTSSHKAPGQICERQSQGQRITQVTLNCTGSLSHDRCKNMVNGKWKLLFDCKTDARPLPKRDKMLDQIPIVLQPSLWLKFEVIREDSFVFVDEHRDHTHRRLGSYITHYSRPMLSTILTLGGMTQSWNFMVDLETAATCSTFRGPA